MTASQHKEPRPGGPRNRDGHAPKRACSRPNANAAKRGLGEYEAKNRKSAGPTSIRSYVSATLSDALGPAHWLNTAGAPNAVLDGGLDEFIAADARTKRLTAKKESMFEDVN